MQPADEAEPDPAQIAPGCDFGFLVGIWRPVGRVLLASARNETKLRFETPASNGTPRKAMKFIPIDLPTSAFVEYVLTQHLHVSTSIYYRLPTKHEIHPRYRLVKKYPEM